MFKVKLSVFTVTLLAFGLTSLNSAQAATLRVFVSATGNDSNPCTVALPCRSFAAAQIALTAGGEIDVLDPAGYGQVFITKALSIQGHGFAGVSVGSAADAITIDAGATDKVSLRGLLIDGAAIGRNGILFRTGGTLDIQDTVIRNFTNDGILFQPSAASALFISDTRIVANAVFGIAIGIPVVNPNAVITGVIDHAVIEDNGNDGLLFQSGPKNVSVTISDSVISNNAGHGIVVAALATSPTDVMLRNSVVANNGLNGLFVNVSSAAVLRVTKSTITRNAKGFFAQSGGIIESYGDNNVDDNTTDGTPTSTIGLK
jgi:Right handed beta helix region